MSNARIKTNTRSRGGGKPPAQRAQQGRNPAVTPMGVVPTATRGQDDLRSKLRKLTETYKSLCDEPEAGSRFRVRAEILPNREDYITLEMGVMVPGIIEMPWAERSSADVEIQFGSQLERYRSVLTMVRRSDDRLGYHVDIPGAIKLIGTADGDRLLKSAKDFSKLPRDQRDPRSGGVPLGTAPAAPHGGTAAPGYYQAQAAEAAASMQRQAAAARTAVPQHRRSWSDEMDEVRPLPGQQASGLAPITSQRATRQQPAGNDVSPRDRRPESSVIEDSDGEEQSAPPRRSVPPAPSTKSGRQAPAPSTSGGGGRKAPAPSSTG